MNFDPVISQYLRGFVRTFGPDLGDVECDRRTPQSVPVTPEVICLPYENATGDGKPSYESSETAP